MLGHDDHDHQTCRNSALTRAEQRCEALGLRLTAQRRQVLEVLTGSHVPVSAYEIMDRIGDGGRRPSPISVYRALDFLVENRFAHRIESRNAFLACAHDHGEARQPGPDPACVFLLCERCGAAAEAEPEALGGVLAELAGRADFAVRSCVLEVRGTCGRCREGDQATRDQDAGANP